MGFGNGIGIGWPNVSSSRGANLGYFTITEICGQIDPRPIIVTSQLINTNLYNRGDYVDASDNRGNYLRVCLGGIATEPSRNTLTISGPTYTSCGITPFTGYFGFNEYCDGGEANRTYYGPTTQTWQIGQVVRIAGNKEPYTYVIINSIVSNLDAIYPMVTLQGPALDGCPIP